jgi:hypothetical protein
MAVDDLAARTLALPLGQPRTRVREYAGLLGVARGTLQARPDRREVAQGRLDEVGDAPAAVTRRIAPAPGACGRAPRVPLSG